MFRLTILLTLLVMTRFEINILFPKNEAVRTKKTIFGVNSDL